MARHSLFRGCGDECVRNKPKGWRQGRDVLVCSKKTPDSSSCGISRLCSCHIPDDRKDVLNTILKFQFHVEKIISISCTRASSLNNLKCACEIRNAKH